MVLLFSGRYKKEKAERENAEKKLRDLRNTKEDLEDKLNDVARVITKYEQDTRAFRNENDQLRRQLQDLMMNRNFQKNISVEYNVTKRQRSDSNKSLDKYKHEIDELHRENEEFKQLLDSLDNKDGGKGDKDDGKNNTGEIYTSVAIFKMMVTSCKMMVTSFKMMVGSFKMNVFNNLINQQCKLNIVVSSFRSSPCFRR